MSRTALVLAALWGCADPGPLYEPESNPPTEVAPRLFRLTYNLGGDYVRNVTPEGRILFVAHGLAGGPVGDGLVIIDPRDGEARQVASAYRSVLPGLLAGDYAERGARRLLLTLLPPRHGDHYCGDIGKPAPTPSFVGWRLYVLPLVDGAAFSSLPSREMEFPLIAGRSFNTTSGQPNSPKRIRFVPAWAEADSQGTRSFAPALSADGSLAFLSDGEVVWQVDLSDTSVAPVPITPGAQPLLSSDQTHLYTARPVVIDSTESETVVSYGFYSCVQRIVTFAVARWLVFRTDLATGVEDTVGEGAEPVALGDTALVVRRADGLHILRLSDRTSSLLHADSSATSPAVAADASLVAFTSRRFGNPDVMVLFLN